MCTVVLGWQRWKDSPFLVAANRDEMLERPAAGPSIHWSEGVPLLAPKDLRAGGTWIGVNRFGLFAAITNRFGEAPDPARSSRGMLVLEALAHESAVEAAQALAKLPAQAFNPHHLLLADLDSAQLVWNDGRSTQHKALEPGVHILTERSLAGPSPQRERFLRGSLAAYGKSKAPDEALLLELLAVHEDNPLASTCVHVEKLYGTRSSTFIRLDADPSHTRFLHADGPPCTTAYTDLSSQLRDLLRWVPAR